MRLIPTFLAAVFIASACASGGAGVRLDEFDVDGPSELSAGEVAFQARNTGRIEHELVVLRTELAPDDLPVDEAVVLTDSADIQVVASTARIPAGASDELTATLRAGPHVLICNVPGHYQSGMRAALVVG